MALGRRVILSYAVGAFGQGLLPLIVASWLMYFYVPPTGGRAALLSAAIFGTIRLMERAIAAFIEPLVGHLSDRTNTRFGRRIPWIAIGLPFLCLSFAALFFPPAGRPVDDPQVILHLSIALMVFFLSYSCVFGPYSALHPEIARSGLERVRLSVWMSLFEVTSNVTGAIGAAPLVGLGALTVLGISMANGYQLLALCSASGAFVSLMPVIILVKEPERTATTGYISFKDAIAASLANQPFLRYGAMVFALRIASSSAVVAIPYIGTQLMLVDESTASLNLAVVIVVATMAFPLVQLAANRYGKARTLRWGALGYVLTLPLVGTIGLVPIPPMVHGLILFFMAGFSTATLFVLPRPLLADVIDHDEMRTGLRREAMYTGMSGVVDKLGEAFATGVVSYVFALFGQSRAQPLGLRLVGLIGAVALLGGLYVFRRYSLEPA